MLKDIRVVSLFDGISCGRVALERAGFKVVRYVAYEIDPDAINVAAWNWPDIEHCGSVEGADFTKYRGKIDLVMGGFPCTDLSIGKNNREGLAGKHSKLFWEQVRAIKEINPRYFLVENNYGMPKADEAIITETLGVEPIFINSALVSAQTRKRLYWTNIPGVEQPEDLGILLRDILEPNPPRKYYHSDGAVFIETACLQNDTPLTGKQVNVNPSGRGMNGNAIGTDGKSGCVTTNKGEGAKIVQRIGYFGELNISGKVPHGAGLYNAEGKTLCLTTSAGSLGHYALALRTRNTDQGRFKKPEVQLTGKANAITTVTSDSMVVAKAYCPQANSGKKTVSDIPKKRHTPIYEQGREGVPVFLVEAGLLHYKDRQIPVKLDDGYYAIRKLTPLECERLQTLPDHYTDMVSDTQRYRQLGNGWTADVIAHILRYIHDDIL